MKKYRYLIVCFCVLLVLGLWAYSLEPKVKPVNKVAEEVLLGEVDSLLLGGNWENRQSGYVNLEKFKALAVESPYFLRVENARGDSLKFIAKDSRIFFGPSGELLNFKNLGISVNQKEKSFTADVKTIDDVKYIYIPYHVLISLAN